MPHAAGDVGAIAWANGVDTAVAGKLDTTVASSTYGALKNGAGAPVLGQTSMFNRQDINGTVINGDATPKGCLEVYTQIGALAHDLALIVHGHADLHFSHAGPSNRAQLLTITGTPTGGTFTLTYGGQTTAPLAYNAAGATVQAALLALSTLVGSTVLVYSATGGTPAAGGPWTISLTIADPTALTASAALTGGSSPSVTITQTVPDGQAYFDLPIGGTIPIAGNITGDVSANGSLISKIGGDGTGAIRWRGLADNDLMVLNSGGGLGLGTLALGGAASYPTLTGGGTVGGLICYANTATGLNGIFRFRDNPTDNVDRAHIDTAAPTSGNTILTLSYHNGTAVAFQKVTLGAADSGGTGFKSLRVPN